MIKTTVEVPCLAKPKGVRGCPRVIMGGSDRPAELDQCHNVTALTDWGSHTTVQHMSGVSTGHRCCGALLSPRADLPP